MMPKRMDDHREKTGGAYIHTIYVIKMAAQFDESPSCNKSHLSGTTGGGQYMCPQYSDIS